MLSSNPPDEAEFQRGVELRESGRLAESKEILNNVYTSRLQLQGPEHPHTVCVRSQLGRTLREMGDFEAACELHVQDLEIRRRLLGRQHEWTKNSMRILAGTLEKMGRGDAAASLRIQADLNDLFVGHGSSFDNTLDDLVRWASATREQATLAPTLLMAIRNEAFGVYRSKGHRTACKACGRMMYHDMSGSDDDLCWIDVNGHRV
jgi:hypothetical protein